MRRIPLAQREALESLLEYGEWSVRANWGWLHMAIPLDELAAANLVRVETHVVGWPAVPLRVYTVSRAGAALMGVAL
jgi:hypothetical protein